MKSKKARANGLVITLYVIIGLLVSIAATQQVKIINQNSTIDKQYKDLKEITKEVDEIKEKVESMKKGR